MKLALIYVLSQRNGREMGDWVNTDRRITTDRRNTSGLTGPAQISAEW